MKKINVGDYVMVVYECGGMFSREAAKVLAVTKRYAKVSVDDRIRWYYLKDVMPWYS
tara:strand:+ start:2073 stop:2243 length:171 start_codon:yes stop_codon:yes gene_type:complete